MHDGALPEVRYARHLVLPEIGPLGQDRLASARVLVVGAGGLGSPVLLYLAAAGVGEITIADDDVVSLSNLQRQVLHATSRLGHPKIASAADRLADLNPDVRVVAHATRVTADTVAGLVSDQDLVIDCTDNLAARHLLNLACVAAGVPMLSGAIAAWEGQVGLYDPARGGPCFACVFPETGPRPDQGKGVVGALPGIVGATMAMEAIKAIIGAGASLRGQLVLIDTLWNDRRLVRVARDPGCPVCGQEHGTC